MEEKKLLLYFHNQERIFPHFSRTKSAVVLSSTKNVDLGTTSQKKFAVVEINHGTVCQDKKIPKKIIVAETF